MFNSLTHMLNLIAMVLFCELISPSKDSMKIAACQVVQPLWFLYEDM